MLWRGDGPGVRVDTRLTSDVNVMGSYIAMYLVVSDCDSWVDTFHK
jgi:hypothetical protein